MARSIAAHAFLGNEKVLYAIWQEVFWAHAVWQGLGAMQ
jgi:hypothetical protein